METVIEVIGVNEDIVLLSGDNVGVDGMWLASELSGFYDPEIQAVTKRRANRPGTRFVSHRILERTVIFKVSIENGKGPGNTWRERDNRWRRLWDYDRYSIIRVTTDEGTRNLHVRLEAIEIDTPYDPDTNDVTDVIMTVVADDPFWYAPPYVEDVIINKSGALEVLHGNPTGNNIYPVWVLEGGTKWSIPHYEYDFQGNLVKASKIDLPKLETVDGDLVVNTDPAERQLVATGGTNVWGRMNGVRFKHPIPPYTDKVNFQLSHNSSTPKSAQVRLVRPFNRPWGNV